jgi:HK97 gp10 family phage protein
MARSSTKVRYLPQGEKILAIGPELRSVLQHVVDEVAADVARGAPRAPGRGHARGAHGADTVIGVVREIPGGWEGRVAWAKSAYYLRMHDRGTVHMPARPFVKPAIERRRAI